MDISQSRFIVLLVVGLVAVSIIVGLLVLAYARVVRIRQSRLIDIIVAALVVVPVAVALLVWSSIGGRQGIVSQLLPWTN